MSIFKLSGKTLILILLLGILIIMLFLVSIYSSRSPQPTPSASSIPKLNPSDFPSQSFTPQQALNTSPQKSVYNDQDLERDFQRIKNKQPLSSPDSESRSSLISSLNNESGYLTQNSNYKIEYVRGPNIFMIELLSTNTDSVQAAAIDWLKSKGLSNQGICNLPVMIYLNYDVAQTLEQQNIVFNPIPKICQ